MTRELFEEIHRWAEETFSRGRQRTPVPGLNHLKKEIDEVLADPSDVMEFADAFMLLIDALQIAGFTYDDISAALREKLEINKRREWVPTGPDGIIEHVRVSA